VAKLVEHFLNSQRKGLAFYWDQEQAVDDAKRQKIEAFRSKRVSWEYGVTAERIFDRIIKMCKEIAATASDTPILLALDSLAALETEDEYKMAVNKKGMMGPLAQLMSRVLRKLKPILQETNALLVITNQIRHRPGQMAFQDDESPGGEALKFWADYRIKTSPMGQYRFAMKGADVDDDDDGDGTGSKQRPPPDGLLIKFKTVKNKLAPPLRTITMPMLFAPRHGSPAGLSEVWSLFDHLKKVTKNITVKSGRHYVKLLGADKAVVEEVSFTRGEWPALLFEKRALLMPHVDRWLAATMMEGNETVGEVEDHDFEPGGMLT
jgi:recombination protein RecA